MMQKISLGKSTFMFSTFAVFFLISTHVASASLDAALVQQNIPKTTLKVNEEMRVGLTFRNIGSETWQNDSVTYTGYSLNLIDPEYIPNYFGNQPPRWGVNSNPGLPKDKILPGEEATFNLTLKAPKYPGTYVLKWHLQKNTLGSNSTFGDETPPILIKVEPEFSLIPTPDFADFVSQNVPTKTKPGQRIQVKVTVKNTGTTEWKDYYPICPSGCGPDTFSLNYISSSNQNWHLGLNSRVSLPRQNIKPGEVVDFIFNITAPIQPGTYPFQFRMSHNIASGLISVPTAFGEPTTPIGILVTDDATILDTDGDSIPNIGDNCTIIANTYQYNSNAGQDVFGNVCDADYNNDNIVNNKDALLLQAGNGLSYGAAGYNADYSCKDAPGNTISNNDFISCFLPEWGRAPGPSGIAY